MIYGQQTIRVMQNVINSDVVIIYLSVFYVFPSIDEERMVMIQIIMMMTRGL